MLICYLNIYCIILGKDRVIFVTAEDHSAPSKVSLPEDDDEEAEGLIKPSGEINWDCPCLQGMADGPCGEQFKAAFSCFHYSQEEVKGSDCVPQFRDMQICFSKYPEIYGKDDDDDNEEIKDEQSDNIQSIEDKSVDKIVEEKRNNELTTLSASTVDSNKDNEES